MVRLNRSRGASLIMGALTLNIWVAALIYEDVENHSKKMVLTTAPCDLDFRVLEPPPEPHDVPSCEVKVNCLLGPIDRYHFQD